jgi:hypothetical protein
MPPSKVPPSGFVEPCIPTLAYKVPSGPDWIHEVKHDGYGLQVRREGDAVRLFTRRGFDWTARYPAIVRTGRLCAEATGSRSSKTSIGAGSSSRQCCTRSTSWSSEAKTCGRFPFPIGRGSSQSSSAGAVSESCSRSTLTRHIPGGLSDGAGGRRLKAALLALSIGSVDGLAEGQKSAQPGDDPSAGSRLVNFAARGTL